MIRPRMMRRGTSRSNTGRSRDRRSYLVCWLCALIAGALTLASLAFVPSGSAWAIDGNNSLELTPLAGWDAFELVTQVDDISAIADVGYGNTASRGKYDGLGGYLNGNELSVFINHETSDAAISRLDLDLFNFQQAVQSTIDGGVTSFPSSIATGMGYSYDTIYDANYHAVNFPNPVATGTVGVGTYGDANFDRFCSGSSYLPEAFGPGAGFVDSMYMTGEEVSGGQFYAIDQATGTMWEVPDVGNAAWENAAAVDTGNTTHVALVLMSDIGSSPGDYIRMYVGEKNIDANGDGTIDFLERNGLRGGTVHYFDPDGAASTTDLPDGLVTGTWNTSTSGALLETKLEDVHTNPADGTQLVFADQTDGIYIMDLDMQFSGGSFDTGASTVSIDQIDDDDVAPIGAPDNLVWSANQKIYVQEDGDGDDMWEINPDGSGRVQIASAFSEPSGIVDVSELTGFQPGSVLLTSIMGSGGSGAQLSVLVSPIAAPLCAIGDADCDGYVSNLEDIQAAFTNFTGPGTTNWTTPKTRVQGDVHGDVAGATSFLDPHDSDVDNLDIQAMFTNFNPAPDAAGDVLGSAGDLDPAIPDLIYDPVTGDVTIDWEGNTLISYVLKNATNSFIPGNHSTILLGSFPTATSNELSESTSFAEPGVTTRSMGNVFPTGLDLTGLQSMLTVNSIILSLGGPQIPFDLVVLGPAVPEPSTWALAAMAMLGLGLIARRRR